MPTRNTSATSLLRFGVFTTDNRDHWRKYDLPNLIFGPAIEIGICVVLGLIISSLFFIPSYVFSVVLAPLLSAPIANLSGLGKEFASAPTLIIAADPSSLVLAEVTFLGWAFALLIKESRLPVWMALAAIAGIFFLWLIIPALKAVWVSGRQNDRITSLTCPVL